MINILSISSIFISLISVTILIIQHFNDKPKLELSYDIMASDDFSSNWIRIYIVNIGRRPILLKSVGFYDWASGYNITHGENSKINILLNESEIHYIDHKIKMKEIWRIGNLFVTDHQGKKWSIKKNKMFLIYDVGHYDGKPNKVFEKSHTKTKEMLYKKYSKIILQNGRKPVDYKDFN